MNKQQIIARLTLVLIGACRKGGSKISPKMASEIASEIVEGKFNRPQLMNMCEATPIANRGTVVDGLLRLAEIARSR